MSENDRYRLLDIDDNVGIQFPSLFVTRRQADAAPMVPVRKKGGSGQRPKHHGGVDNRAKWSSAELSSGVGI